MRGSGKIITLKVKESLSIRMELFSMDSGRMGFNMEEASRPGQMALFMMDFTNRVESMDRVRTPSLTIQGMSEDGKMMQWTVLVSLIGRMDANTMVPGRII